MKKQTYLKPIFKTTPDPSALIAFLNKAPSISYEVSLAIAGEFEYRQLAKGELFVTSGKVANEYMFLEKGYMRSYILDTAGNEITMNLYAENSIVFEVASFFERTPSEESVEAATDCAGWVLTYEKLNNLFHESSEFREFGRAMLVRGFITFKLRALSLLNKTAEERYERLLKANPAFFQAIPLKQIASYLGITDTSLSRIRKSLTQK